jgi:hypothetical protein
MITSFSPAIWSGDFPMHYVGDCFYLEGGQLEVIHAPYDSFEQYKQTFFNPTAWSATVDFFAKNDPLDDSFVSARACSTVPRWSASSVAHTTRTAAAASCTRSLTSSAFIPRARLGR